MTAVSNARRSRLRLIRRTDRKRKGLPLRRPSDDREPRDFDDLDTPDDDLIGVTE